MDSEKRRLVQRLIKKLLARPTDVDPNATDKFTSYYGNNANEDHITTAARYTGLHPTVLRRLETDVMFETVCKPVDRAVIYNKLVEFYTEKNKIPSTYELFSELQGTIPPYLDIGSFRKLLVKMDFVWKKINKSNAVVIENPLVRFERYNYLKRIQIFRTSGADVYSIDNGAYNSTGQFKDHKLTIHFNIHEILQSDWVQRVIFALGPDGIVGLREIDDVTPDEVETWVRDVLLPNIRKPGVFILKNTEHYNRRILNTPTLDSLKSDIAAWLDWHRVTYDAKMSKYEMFALADKFTDLNKDLFKIDEILKTNGHTVLRIPKCIENLTSSVLLHRLVDEGLPIAFEETKRLASGPVDRSVLKELFRDVVMNLGETFFEKFEQHLAETENGLIAVEDKVDRIYDNLLKDLTKKDQPAATTNVNADSDLPSCSDSE